MGTPVDGRDLVPRMFDADSSQERWPKWMALALFLHAGLLFAVPRGGPEAVRAPQTLPVQVSLLDPAPQPGVVAEAVAPPPEAVKPKPRPTPRPRPAAAPTPAPRTETPSPEPVAELASAESASVAESTNASAAQTERTSNQATTNEAAGGGAFSDARYDAAYLHNPEPPYPPMSKKMRETGRVTLRVFVLASGSAGKVEIKNSSGFARLDESARTTVLEKWRFVPARRGNENVDAWVNLSVSFNLRS